MATFKITEQNNTATLRYLENKIEEVTTVAGQNLDEIASLNAAVGYLTSDLAENNNMITWGVNLLAGAAQKISALENRIEEILIGQITPLEVKVETVCKHHIKLLTNFIQLETTVNRIDDELNETQRNGNNMHLLTKVDTLQTTVDTIAGKLESMQNVPAETIENISPYVDKKVAHVNKQIKENWLACTTRDKKAFGNIDENLKRLANAIEANFNSLDGRISDVETQMVPSDLRLDLVLPPTPTINNNKRPGEVLFPLIGKRSKMDQRVLFPCAICVLDGKEKEFTSARGVQSHMDSQHPYKILYFCPRSNQDGFSDRYGYQKCPITKEVFQSTVKGDLVRHIRRYHKQENIKIKHLDISNESFKQVPIFGFPENTINGKCEWKLMPIVKQYYEGMSFKTEIGRPNFTESNLVDENRIEEYTVEWVEGDLFCTSSPSCNFSVYTNNDSTSNGTKLMDDHINAHLAQDFQIQIDANQDRHYVNEENAGVNINSTDNDVEMNEAIDGDNIINTDNDVEMNERLELEIDTTNIINTATPRKMQEMEDMMREWGDMETNDNLSSTEDKILDLLILNQDPNELFDSDYDEENDPDLMQEEDEDQHVEDLEDMQRRLDALKS